MVFVSVDETTAEVVNQYPESWQLRARAYFREQEQSKLAAAYRPDPDRSHRLTRRAVRLQPSRLADASAGDHACLNDINVRKARKRSAATPSASGAAAETGGDVAVDVDQRLQTARPAASSAARPTGVSTKMPILAMFCRISIGLRIVVAHRVADEDRPQLAVEHQRFVEIRSSPRSSQLVTTSWSCRAAFSSACASISRGEAVLCAVRAYA